MGLTPHARLLLHQTSSGLFKGAARLAAVTGEASVLDHVDGYQTPFEIDIHAGGVGAAVAAGVSSC